MPYLKLIFRGIDYLTKFFGYLGGLMILGTSLAIVYEVVSRFLFNSPTTWVTESSVYLVIGAGFFGMAYALKTDHHIQVDLITSKLTPKAKSALDVITSFLSTIFCVILVWKGLDMIYHNFAIHRVSPTPLRVPMYLPQLPLGIGAILLTLQFIRRTLQSLLDFLEMSPVLEKEERVDQVMREAGM